MNQQCTICPTKDAIIRQQQLEISRLNRIIEQAQGACVAIHGEASQVLSTHQPRGTWAFAKGKLEAAQTIVRYLGGKL